MMLKTNNRDRRISSYAPKHFQSILLFGSSHMLQSLEKGIDVVTTFRYMQQETVIDRDTQQVTLDSLGFLVQL